MYISQATLLHDDAVFCAARLEHFEAHMFAKMQGSPLLARLAIWRTYLALKAQLAQREAAGTHAAAALLVAFSRGANG